MFLTLSIIVSLVSALSIPAFAAQPIVLSTSGPFRVTPGSVLPDVPEGTYFTWNGAKCTGHSNESTCVNQVNLTYAGGAENIPLYATQCLGFARYCIYRYTGVTPKQQADLSLKGVKCDGIVETHTDDQHIFNASQMKEILHNTPAGSHLRIYRGNYAHSMIMLYANNSEVQVYDCNASPSDHCRVDIRTYTYQEMADYVNSGVGNLGHGFSYIHSPVISPEPTRIYRGSEFTSDAALAAKLDGIFSAYPPGTASWPGLENADYVDLGVSNSAANAKSYQYARWCFYRLFGYVDKLETGEQGKYDALQILSPSDVRDLTAAQVASVLKTGLSGAPCGTHLRVSYQHSYILLGIGANSVTVLDADRTGGGQVRIDELTYDQLAATVKQAQSVWGSSKNDITIFIHMPTQAAPVIPPTPTPTPTPSRPVTPSFKDVASSAWYAAAVSYVTSNGIMNGISATSFSPDTNLTRAMLAQLLYNKEGKPAASGGGFSDVSSDAWFSGAVGWAASQGIVSGYGNGSFGPDDNITREQLVVMLWRYAGKPAGTGNLNGFADSSDISPYAVEAMKWAVGAGAVNGINGLLVPSGTATRAQVAQIMMKYFEA